MDVTHEVLKPEARLARRKRGWTRTFDRLHADLQKPKPRRNTVKIVTSLSFQGECREAFDFYARVLGGKVTAAFPFGEGPADMPVDPKYKDWLMHCWLEIGDQALMGADMPPEFAPNIDKPKNGFDVTFHRGRRRGEACLRGPVRGRQGRHGLRRDLLVARLRQPDRPVRHPVDGQHHAGSGLASGGRGGMKIARWLPPETADEPKGDMT
jgi:hypothetical protein